ncbi:MAG: hypothetical protein QM783_16970 [Phycisphaerales bacterium]
MNTPSSSTPARWLAGDWFVRVGVAGYIAAGALAKLTTGQPLQLPLISLQTDPSAETERLAAAVFPVICAVELVVAGAILLGGRWSRWLAFAVLVAFAGVLIPHIKAESESCGCFGAAQTSPAFMLTTAIAGAALTLLLPFSGRPVTARPARWTAAWGLAAVVLVAGVWFSHLPEHAGWRTETVRLRPADWVGKSLADTPFYSLLESPSGVAVTYPEPEQTWVLWLRTCPHCHEYFHERWSEPTDKRIVAVEIPLSAKGIGSEPYAIECPSCVRLHLKAGRLYAPAPTPIIVKVRDGKIVAAESNPSSSGN